MGEETEDGGDVTPPVVRVRWWDRLSVTAAALSTRAAAVCFWTPLVGALGAGVLSALFAPKIDPGKSAGDFAPLFATAAGLIGALLIALAVEAGWLGVTETNVRRRIVGGTVLYVAVGAVAAVLALIPTLSSNTYRVLFVLTMAGGAGALLSVLAVAYYVAESQLDVV